MKKKSEYVHEKLAGENASTLIPSIYESYLRQMFQQEGYLTC